MVDDRKKGKASLKKLKEEREEYLNGWKRAKADLANYKKEEQARFERLRKFCQEGLITEVLSVLDSFGLALKSIKDEESSKGVKMIQAQLLDVLKRSGLEVIEPKKGDVFDEKTSESVGESELEDKKFSGKISEVIALGYRLNGKVIRAAKVNLGK